MIGMTRVRSSWVLAAVAIAIAGCGDNARICGVGTEVDDTGACVPVVTPPMCTDGTILDVPTNSCVIDPNACQDGTVLVNNHCQDPTSGLSPDVQEGAEPNGFGIGGERSPTPAGLFTLHAIGSPGVILHGTIVPRADADEDGQPEADFDTYLVDVPGPTLLAVTADGVHGLSAGFLAVTDAAGLTSWIRFGVNLTGDTSQRQLFLPGAGRYAIAIADARTLISGSAVGSATSDYYVTIDQLAIPTAEALTAVAGEVTKTGTLGAADTRFYAVPLGTGLNELTLSTDAHAVTGAVGVYLGTASHGAASESKTASTDAPATLIAGGLAPTDGAIIVVDQELTTTTAPTAFTLHVTTRDAPALSTTGGTTALTNLAVSPGSYAELATTSFEATAAGDVLGLDVQWSRPVDGVLLDGRGDVVSAFSWDPSFGAVFGFWSGFGSATWTRYRGTFRAPAAGRYYFAVYDPAGAVGDSLVATSTIETLAATTLTLGTPLTGVTPAATGAALIDYPGDATPWQLFSLVAGPATGGATASFYDPATTFGRLDRLALTGQSSGTQTSMLGDGVPLVVTVGSLSLAAGHIALGEPAHLFGVVRPLAPGAVDLSTTARTFTDEGTHASGFTVTHAAEALDATTPQRRYLLRTDPNNRVTVALHPTSAALDVSVASVTAREVPIATADAAGAGADETLAVTADARGYVAFVVNGALATGAVDVTLTIGPPFYTVHGGTTAWTNACPGGTDVTPADRDDGFTTAIALPAGFEAYGTPVSAIKISTNGWFTFDAAATIGAAASRTEQALPSPVAPNNLVAAYWDDLDQVRICTKISGTKFVVQWRGVLYAAPSVAVAAQAILDAADHSVELVYAPFLEATGSSASVGVEGPGGAAGTSVVFHKSTLAAGSAVRLAHP